MRLFTVVPGPLLIALSKGPSHNGKPQSLSEFQVAAFWHGKLYAPADDLRMAVSDEIEVSIKVSMKVLDPVELRPVPAPGNRAVACEYRDCRTGGVAAPSALKLPSGEAVVSKILKPQPEA